MLNLTNWFWRLITVYGWLVTLCACRTVYVVFEITIVSYFSNNSLHVYIFVLHEKFNWMIEDGNSVSQWWKSNHRHTIELRPASYRLVLSGMLPLCMCIVYRLHSWTHIDMLILFNHVLFYWLMISFLLKEILVFRNPYFHKSLFYFSQYILYIYQCFRFC